MDILYTVYERYLQALEELKYGELPKALHFFNAIINIDPEYARDYFQLGCCYYYQFKNYQTAGYYLKKCIEIEPSFPDVYVPYLKLLITLKMHRSITNLAEKALQIPGIGEAEVHEILGKYAEERGDLVMAKEHYQRAALTTICQTEHDDIQDHIKRICSKQNMKKTLLYTLQS